LVYWGTDQVWFIGVQIKGDLDLSLCSFTHGVNRSEIVLSRSEIGGRFFFRRVTGAVESIIMRVATITAIADDIKSWGIADQLLLDGLQYRRFIDAHLEDEPDVWSHHISPTDAASRIAWLDRQREQDLGLEFKPQPWEQLITVLREVGHQEGARQVAIAKQERIHKSTRISALLHRLYGITCRYGYRPSWLILWAIGVAVVGAVLFKIAGSTGVMAPTDRRMFEEVKDIACRPEHGGNWTTCPTLHRRGYPSFDPTVYSLDLILPVIATQQTKDWAPLTTVPCQT
jgi:hypothetical protein